MSDLSQKYDFLLHPIKDLTKNWNVDIASVLEDFLVELEKMTFSFDGGKTKVNFAEASFLIQGTACVWSRKVESLYNLVYQTLEMISSNKQNKHPSSVNAQGIDNDATFDNHEDKFLELDDHRNVLAKKIPGSGAVVSSLSRHSTYLQGSEEDRGSPFLNKKGEVTNYYHDFWSNNMTPQITGMALLDIYLKNKSSFIQQTDKDSESNSEKTIEQPADDFMEDLDDHHDNDEGDVDAIQMFDQSAVEPKVDDVEMKHNLRPRNPPPASIFHTPDAPQLDCTLDPHSECKRWVEKPFRKAKTLKFPPSLVQNKKKRKREPSAAPIPLIRDFLDATKKLIKGTESDFVKEEQKRRNERLKKLKDIHLQNRVDIVDDAANYEDDVFVQNDNDIDELNDDDAPDLDDLINDVEDGIPATATAPSTDFQENPDNIETYEDLVRHHVEKFYASAKRYVQESALNQAVKEWHETIQPFVDQQDSRPEFDIHQYGDSMVSNFREVGSTKLFSDCTSHEEHWSICRLFAATLQLANDGNFELSTEDNFKESVNSLSLKLLTQNKLRDRIDDYAPS